MKYYNELKGRTAVRNPHVTEDQRKRRENCEGRTGKSERKPYERREEQHERENHVLKENAMKK